MKLTTTKNMLAMLVTCSFLTACGSSSDKNDTPVSKTIDDGKVKNVILMIGDGMGAQQVGLLEEYARRAPNSVLATTTTGLQQFADNGRLGLSMNAPMGANPSLVVDSACSASQLAT
ncbi:MAG: alkaline phosphatase, partial [Bermanella sp.]